MFVEELIRFVCLIDHNLVTDLFVESNFVCGIGCGYKVRILSSCADSMWGRVRQMMPRREGTADDGVEGAHGR